MDWWQALILGIVQGLTEFLPVSSSGHLVIFGDILNAPTGEEFLDFTVAVHMGTVLSTIVVFWAAIWKLLKGVFKFTYNDETDYICKIAVSMVPVFVVGVFFKKYVENLFGHGLYVVGAFLLVTAVLLVFSDLMTKFRSGKAESAVGNSARNGITYWQAITVGLGQACAVAPGLSRSGTTIATGLICGVRRDVMAQFSFLMVLVPIIGEQCLDVLKAVMAEPGSEHSVEGGVGALALLVGFAAAFISGLFACKVMVALVRKAKLSWFALYCVALAVVIFVFA